MTDDTQPTDDTQHSGAQLTALMTRSVEELTVPLDRLRHGAVADGRRLKRRRRVLAGLTGTGAAAALVVALSPGLPGADQPGFATDPTPSYSETANPPSTESTAGGYVDPGPGFWDMPAREMLNRLGPLLPSGVSVVHAQLTVPDPAPGQSPKARGWLRVTLARAGVAGQADLELMLWNPVHEPGAVECPGNLEPGPGVVCTPLADGAGRRVQITTGAVVVRGATVHAGKGFVYVATANSTDDKWGAGSGTSTAEPLLSLDEVEAIARADAWAAWSPPQS
jgi:hypothetical protein